MESTQGPAVPEEVWDLIIIGAGMSGVAGRQRWLESGHDCLLIEKSRGTGGRATTKRHAPGVIADAGAPFATVRRVEWRTLLEGAGGREASAIGGIRGDQRINTEQWIHPEGMNRFIKHLLSNPDRKDSPVVFQKRALSVRKVGAEQSSGGYAVSLESGEVLRARNLMISSPIPQSLAILEGASILSLAQTKLLESVEYDSCFVLTVLGPEDAVSGASEAFQAGSGNAEIFERIIEQKSKGLATAGRVWVAYAAAEWSRKHWQLSDEEAGKSLFQELERLLQLRFSSGRAPEALLHRWRYSRVQAPMEAPFLRAGDTENGHVYLIGDAFLENTLEGAFFSGRAAAEDLISLFGGRATP